MLAISGKAVLKLAAVSQQERFSKAAIDALTYERSLFSPQQGNWIRRLEEDEKSFSVAWGPMTPGIGLGRLAMLAYLGMDPLCEEIEIALETTLKREFGHNLSLCHGDLGNLETILIATQLLGEARYQEALTRLISQIFATIQEHGWVTGVPLGAETPDLMTGLAGIGYQLLGLAAPEKIPSILLLAPPHIKG